MEQDINLALAEAKEASASVFETVQAVAAVTDAASEQRAAEFLKGVKEKMKAVEDARTRLVKPLSDHVKMINAQFKAASAPLEEADRIVRDGMAAYRNSPAFKEAEAKRLAIETEARQAVAEGDVVKLQWFAVKYEDAASAAPKQVATDTGAVRFREVWRHEIEDLEKVPAAYWQLNEKKIAEDVKKGAAIPGIRSWTEKTTIVV